MSAAALFNHGNLPKISLRPITRPPQPFVRSYCRALALHLPIVHLSIKPSMLNAALNRILYYFHCPSCFRSLQSTRLSPLDDISAFCALHQTRCSVHYTTMFQHSSLSRFSCVHGCKLPSTVVRNREPWELAPKPNVALGGAHWHLITSKQAYRVEFT